MANWTLLADARSSSAGTASARRGRVVGAVSSWQARQGEQRRREQAERIECTRSSVPPGSGAPSLDNAGIADRAPGRLDHGQTLGGRADAGRGDRSRSLDQPVFDGAGATKGDLVSYLDAVHERMLPELRDRALSVVRARLGQQPFMQKNLPKYAPDWIRTTTVWANASKREVHYPVCDDRRTLVWLANQRAVEYHPALMRVDSDRQTHLILDLDPPDDVDPLDGFRMAVAAALLVRQALEDAGLSGGVKTSGAKGVHVFVPAARGRRDPGRRGGDPGRWRPGRRGWTRVSRPPSSCARSAAARCSSTPRGRVARPWWRRTARGRGPAYRCRSRSPGPSSSRCGPATSRS